jgi:hypothetical protein
MTKAAAITAQVVDICNDRQHKGSIKITLHVPVEVGARLTEILGWPTHTTPVPVALARLNESAVVADAPAVNLSPSHAPAAGVATNRLTKRAGILGNDPLFHKYLVEMWLDPFCTVSDDPKERAAMFIRLKCKVESRKDILPGTEAATRFDLLESAYVGWREKDAVVEQ